MSLQLNPSARGSQGSLSPGGRGQGEGETRRRSLLRFSALATALLLSTSGCGQGLPHTGVAPRPPAADPASSSDVRRPTSDVPRDAVPLGKLTVLLKWPEVLPLKAKVLPDSSTTATITVSALDLADPIATTVNRSPGQTSVSATLTIPTGTNRSITVKARNGGILTASGSAAGITVASTPNPTVPIVMTATTVPAITSLSQANGGPGATVTLTGTNFIPPGTTAPDFTTPNTGTTVWNVKFNGTAATVSSWSNTAITCTVPTGATNGTIVVTADAVPSASTAGFTVLQALTVSPAGPTVNVGATQAFTAGATDTNGANVASPVVSWTSSSPGVGTITSGGVFTGVSAGTTTITAASGTLSAGTTATVVGPTLSSLSPSSGGIDTLVTLTGLNFGAVPGLSTVTFNGVAAAPYSPFSADGNTTALWHFDEASGSTVADSSGNNNTGTASGTAIIESYMGRGRSFNGNESVSIPYAAGLTPQVARTYEVWVKPSDITTNWANEVLRQEGGTLMLLCFQNNGTILSFGLDVGGYTELDVPITPSEWTDGKWHYIAATFDGSTKKVYKDGVLIGTENRSGSIANESSAALYIGSRLGNDEFFHGAIDEVRISNVARTATEIGDHWNANDPANWSDTQVKVKVPSGATTGPVVVRVDGHDSNGVTFTVQ